MGLEPNLPFALWLLPAPTWADGLENIIRELAQRHGSRPFVPHVTIGSANGSADGANHGSAVEGLARKWCPLELSVDGFGWGPDYFTFLFLRLKQPCLTDLLGEALAALPGSHGPEAGLHLSLLYADPTPGAPGAAIDRPALAEELTAQLLQQDRDRSISFDRLALVQPGPGGWRDGWPWSIGPTFSLVGTARQCRH